MKILPAPAPDQAAGTLQEVVDLLREGGLACFPGHRQYVIAASLLSEDAVLRLVQSKRRSGKAPSLVLVPDKSALSGLTDEVSATAKALADAFWPGPLTLLISPGGEVPSRVLKAIGLKKSAKLGVRVPESGFASDVARSFGGPLLVSSANLSHKVGSGSASHIRKDFHHTVDLFIDAGDLPAGTPSTVVDPDGDGFSITREGRIGAAQIQEALRAAGLLAG